MSELKVQFPPEERPTTTVSLLVVVIFSSLITVAIFGAIYPFKGTFIRDLIMGRNEISLERVIFQGLTLWMWQMSTVTVVLKFLRLAKEMRLVRKDFIPPDMNLRDLPGMIEVHQKIMTHPQLAKSVALTRMGRVLAMWINTEDTERTLAYARIESEMDIFLGDSTYRANRLYIWAMPLLGFVGTVFGVSFGIGGFAEFLRGKVTSAEIQFQVGLITEGLAVAFYCTLLGLLTAGIAAFPSLAAEKKEEELMGELDQYMEDRITSRLPSVRKVEFPMGDIQAMRENLDRMQLNISSDELLDAIKNIKIEFPMEEFTAALSSIKFNLPMDDFVAGIKDGLQDLRLNVIMPMEDLSRAIDQGFRRLPNPDNYVTVFSRAIAEASTLVSAKYEEFARGYEHRIHELGSSFAGRLDGVASSIQTGTSGVSASINQQAGALVNQFESAMKQMQASSGDYTQRVDESTKVLASQVARVTEIAAQIDHLLQATKAMEAAFTKLSSSEEFGQTLAAIRSHLATSDAFVQRMTKPRKVVLLEETVTSE